MFIVGLKRLERARGSGWLDCPNCHEHALQDVLDAMRFAAIGFYRLGPVERTRYLICRRCGYRREAVAQELDTLETMGQPLKRAWFVPFGVIALLLVGVIVYVGFASPTAGKGVAGITFTTLDGDSLIHATVEVPNSWDTTFFTKPDDVPPPRVEIQTTSTGLEKIVLARFTDSATLGDLIFTHFADQTSLVATQFPSVPPKASCTKMGGVTAALVRIPFLQGGGKAELLMYAFFHGTYGYTMTFVASGAGNITTVEQIADHAATTLKFTGSESAPSASPGASPAPSPSAAVPGSSPSPSYSVSCS